MAKKRAQKISDPYILLARLRKLYEAFQSDAGSQGYHVIEIITDFSIAWKYVQLLKSGGILKPGDKSKVKGVPKLHWVSSVPPNIETAKELFRRYKAADKEDSSDEYAIEGHSGIAHTTPVRVDNAQGTVILTTTVGEFIFPKNIILNITFR